MNLDLLTLPERPLRWPLVTALMLLAWGLGIFVRVLWLHGAEANPQAVWEGAMTLTVTDGYFYASAVQRAIEGLHEYNMRVPLWSDHAITLFATAITQLGVGMREVLVYLPGVSASLIVVPLILIGRQLRAPLWGFGAALLAVAGASYYSRTLMGYFDTDMFAVTVPVFLLWLMVRSAMERRHEPAGWASALIVVAPFFYSQIGSVLLAMVLTFGAYLIVFHRRDPFAWPALLMTLIALWPFPWFVTLPPIAAVYLLARGERLGPRQWFWAAIGALIVLLTFSPLFTRVLSQLSSYTDRAASQGGPGDISFEKVSGIVREMQILPFTKTVQRFAGTLPILIAASVGYLLMVVRYRPMLLAAPLIALGLFAQWGGLRFTVYIVPVVMMSAAYLAFIFSAGVARLLPRLRPLATYGLSALLIAAMLAPQVERALARAPVTVVRTGEAEVMSQLGDLIEPGDYTLAWWDFGYPLWFFAHSATLIDGGKHRSDNFILSEILFCRSQREAANLSRLAVETYAERSLPDASVIDHLFRLEKRAGRTPRDLIARLRSAEYSPPKATRDIYLYIPHKMLRILRPVEKFSHDVREPSLPTTEGAKARSAFAYLARRYKQVKGKKQINLGRGYIYDEREAVVLAKGGRKIPIRTVAVVQSTKDGRTVNRKRIAHERGLLDLVIMRSYGSALLVDHELFDSVLFQLYVLGEVDDRYFEQVIHHPFGKVFRVKR